MGVITRALRNVSRRKVRVLLVVLALSFSMAIMMSIPSGISASQKATEQLTEKMQQVMEQMENEINTTLTLLACTNLTTGGYDVTIIDQSESGSEIPTVYSATDPCYITESTVSKLKEIAGIKEIIPILEKPEGKIETIETKKGDFEHLKIDYTIAGVSLNSSIIDNYAVLPTKIVEGRNLKEGDSGVVLLSKENAKYFDAKLGDTISLSNIPFKIIGIYESLDILDERKVYMDLGDAQRITHLKGQLSGLDIYTIDESVIDSVSNQIKRLFPEFGIETFGERLKNFDIMRDLYQDTSDNSETTLNQTQALAYQEIGIAIIATSLIVLFTMLYTVRERTHEIGILKAIGFSNGNIMGQLILEGLFMSLIAGVVGIIMGSIVAPILSSFLLPVNTPSNTNSFSSTVAISGNPGQINFGAPIDPQVILLSFSLAVVLGVVGTFYPAWRASKTSPMEAMKHE